LLPSLSFPVSSLFSIFVLHPVIFSPFHVRFSVLYATVGKLPFDRACYAQSLLQGYSTIGVSETESEFSSFSKEKVSYRGYVHEVIVLTTPTLTLISANLLTRLHCKRNQLNQQYSSLSSYSRSSRHWICKAGNPTPTPLQEQMLVLWV